MIVRFLVCLLRINDGVYMGNLLLFSDKLIFDVLYVPRRVDIRVSPDVSWELSRILLKLDLRSIISESHGHLCRHTGNSFQIWFVKVAGFVCLCDREAVFSLFITPYFTFFSFFNFFNSLFSNSQAAKALLIPTILHQRSKLLSLVPSHTNLDQHHNAN
jgi:hypothetical protein